MNQECGKSDDRERSEASFDIAALLLRANAVTLNVSRPYRYASGILSPIYCDNRVLLSYPGLRREIVTAFSGLIAGLSPAPQLVAGVATAGIAWAAWVADACDLPMVYVRSDAKKHGKGNLIEGLLPAAGMHTVVMEDLLSTGGSSVAAVNALRGAGAEVSHCCAIFSYKLPACRKAFEKAACVPRSLTSFDDLLEAAVRLKKISPDDLEIARRWNRDPEAWGASYADIKGVS